MTRTPTKNILLLALSITICLWMGCSSSEMKDFSLDTIEAQSEARLKVLADTSLTLPQIRQYSSTRQQLDSLLYYGEWIKNYEEDVALLYVQQAYDLAIEHNLNFPRAVAAYRIAALKGKKAKFGEDIEDAMVDARISQRLMEDFKRIDWEIPIYNLLGVLYKRNGGIDSSRRYLNKALYKLERLPIESKATLENKAFIFFNLGSTYSLRDTLNMPFYFAKSDSLFRLIENKEGQVNLWLDWGLFYQYQKAYHKADSLYNLCINYGKEKKDNQILAIAYQKKGRMYSRQFAKTDSVIYFDKALKTLKNALKYEDKKSFQYFTYHYIGSSFHDSWAIDIDESHADSAISYYKIALTKARQEGASRHLKVISKSLADLCSDETVNCDSLLGEEVSIFINNNYIGLLDTLTKHSKAAYQRINKEEQRDIRINAANKRRDQLYIGISILVVLGAIFLVLLQGQQNRRLKAEMGALRAQINPHFISNSLNAIESLVNLGNAKAAAKYLVHFSRLSRQILNGSRTATTSLSEELKTLKHFLALEQLRFRDKLAYDIQVAPEVNMDLVIVPSMILQPYVENAIWHGIKPKEAGGKILIDVQKIGKKLRFSVEDNGIGRAKSNALRKASVLKHKSMGMQITEERLKGMGRIKGSQVEIEDLIDNSGNSLGTRVIIQFPYKLRNEKKN